MYKKILITFEGIEGSGKSLHIENVAKYLKKKKISFVKIREPGGSKNSEKIRKLILNNKSNFNRYTDLLFRWSPKIYERILCSSGAHGKFLQKIMSWSLGSNKHDMGVRK